MLDRESHAAHYRRLAQECIAAANTIATEGTRAALIEMAQVWARLAAGYDARPVTQQQQRQIQPESNKKE